MYLIKPGLPEKKILATEPTFDYQCSIRSTFFCETRFKGLVLLFAGCCSFAQHARDDFCSDDDRCFKTANKQNKQFFFKKNEKNASTGISASQNFDVKKVKIFHS